MILGLKSPWLTKNFKKSKFDCTIDFLSDDLKLPFSKGTCDNNAILILLGYLEAINMIAMRIFLIWPKNSSFALVHQMKFYQGKP